MGAARLGFSPEDVGTHSLCSYRAMAMHIAGVPYQTLMTIRRWLLLGFTTDLILQCRHLSAYDQTTLVLAPLRRRLSTKPTQHPIAHSPSPNLSIRPSGILFQTARPHLHPLPRAPHLHAFQPKTLMIPSTGGRSKFPTKIPSGSPSRGPINNFQPTILPDPPSGVHLDFPTKNSSTSPS